MDQCNIVGFTQLNGTIMIPFFYNNVLYYVPLVNMCNGLHMVDNKYLCTLKSYMHSKAYPEGCIAEGYLAEEWATFCSRYLIDVEQSTIVHRNFVDIKDIGDERLIIFKCVGWHWENLLFVNLAQKIGHKHIYMC